MARLPSRFACLITDHVCRPYNPGHTDVTGLGYSPFARRYWGNLF